MTKVLREMQPCSWNRNGLNLASFNTIQEKETKIKKVSFFGRALNAECVGEKDMLVVKH